jgi:hypothetical protein
MSICIVAPWSGFSVVLTSMLRPFAADVNGLGQIALSRGRIGAG